MVDGRKSSKWCHTVRFPTPFSSFPHAPNERLTSIVFTSEIFQHRLNFRALSRALSIRTQLSKYLKRFSIPLVSCGEDHSKIRRCLVSGYFRNAAIWREDGSFISIREGSVRSLFPFPSLREIRETDDCRDEYRCCMHILVQYCLRGNQLRNMWFIMKSSKLLRGLWGRLRVLNWSGWYKRRVITIVSRSRKDWGNSRRERGKGVRGMGCLFCLREVILLSLLTKWKSVRMSCCNWGS